MQPFISYPHSKQQEPVRRDRRNRRRNRKGNFEERKQQQAAIVAEGEGTVIAPSVFSHLLKPPESLISDSIQKYKQMDVETPQSPLVVQELTAVSEPVVFDPVQE